MTLGDGINLLYGASILVLAGGGFLSAMMHQSHKEKTVALANKLDGALKQVNQLRDQVFSNTQAIPSNVASQPLGTQSLLHAAEGIALGGLQHSTTLQPGTLKQSVSVDAVAKTSQGDSLTDPANAG